MSFGSDPDFLHIGISELQLLLLKPCLLLGIQVYFGVEFVSSTPSSRTCGQSGSGWDVLIREASLRGAQRPPGPLIQRERLESVHLLVGGDGPRSVVASTHGFEMVETSSLRKEAALGLVANFANRQTAADKGRRPFALARQFYAPLFRRCEETTGLELENIVCYISSLTHYFVMTPKLRSLQALGIVEEGTDGGSVAKVNQERLAQVVKSVVKFPWKAEDPLLSNEALETPVGPPSLFDFSRTRRAANGLKVMPAAVGTGMLVGLCGDSLIEPFWPEGLGIVRGFFAALDLASAAKVWTEGTEDPQVHFENAFRQLKSLAAKTRDQVLRPEERAYALDPSTRYRFSGSSGGGVVGRHRANSMPASVRRGGA